MPASKSPPQRHIVALGGGGFSTEPDSLLDDYILKLAGKHRPKVCFIPTASGDSDSYVAQFYRAFSSSRCRPSDLTLFNRGSRDLTEFLCRQDVIYVGGGNTANLLAVWRVHGVDEAMAAAWRKGVVLCGVSAGGMCWFQAGITDSFGNQMAPLYDGLGFLKNAFCPHYEGQRRRRPVLYREIRRGFPPTIAANDGAGLHFVGTRLVEAVSSHPHARAYRVRIVSRRVIETPIPTRYLGTMRARKSS